MSHYNQKGEFVRTPADKIIIYPGETVAIMLGRSICQYVGNAGSEPMEIEKVDWTVNKKGWRPKMRKRVRK